MICWVLFATRRSSWDINALVDKKKQTHAQAAKEVVKKAVKDAVNEKAPAKAVEKAPGAKGIGNEDEAFARTRNEDEDEELFPPPAAVEKAPAEQAVEQAIVCIFYTKKNLERHAALYVWGVEDMPRGLNVLVILAKKETKKRAR